MSEYLPKKDVLNLEKLIFKSVMESGFITAIKRLKHHFFACFVFYIM
jgi:hypothetical protein